MILFVPISAVLLVGSMVFIGTESPIAIVSYVIAAYTLTVWCFKIPYLINFFKTFKNENKYVVRTFLAIILANFVKVLCPVRPEEKTINAKSHDL